MAGAAGNLEDGLNVSSRSIDANAAVWVSPGYDFDAFETTSFAGSSSRTLARIPGVAAVRLYRGGFLDWGQRRIWVQAPPASDAHMLPEGRLPSGDFVLAVKRLREGGWAVLSQGLAAEHHLRIGESFTLPAPRPIALAHRGVQRELRLAVRHDRHEWRRLQPGVGERRSKRLPAPAPSRCVRDGCPPAGAAGAWTANRLDAWKRTPSELAQYYASTHQSLARLMQIRLLVLIAAVLAMAAAMGAMIWQRRPRLADMKVDGFRKGVLWRALLIETALLLGAGCSAGAVFGVYGQVLLSHALASVTGFPVVFSVGAGVAIGSFLLVTAVAVAIVAIPGYLAARVRPSIILQD